MNARTEEMARDESRRKEVISNHPDGGDTV